MSALVDGIMGTLRWAELRLAALTSILVLASYSGTVEGFNGAHSSRNLAESITAAAQLGYGTLALCALIAVHRRHRFARPFIEFWGAIFVATAILQPVVWGESQIRTGLLSGFVASLIVGLIIWLWGADRPGIVPQKATTKKVESALQISPRDAEITRELDRIKAKVVAANSLNTLQAIPIRVAETDPFSLQVVMKDHHLTHSPPRVYRAESAGNGASLSITAPRSA
jgi:hypothetical protein